MMWTTLQKINLHSGLNCSLGSTLSVKSKALAIPKWSKHFVTPFFYSTRIALIFLSTSPVRSISQFVCYCRATRNLCDIVWIRYFKSCQLLFCRYDSICRKNAELWAYDNWFQAPCFFLSRPLFGRPVLTSWLQAWCEENPKIIFDNTGRTNKN
jgi:hypothetical protein